MTDRHWKYVSYLFSTVAIGCTFVYVVDTGVVWLLLNCIALIISGTIVFELKRIHDE